MRQTQQPILITSITAATDLTNLRFVGFDGKPVAADGVIMGVCQADTAAGRQAPIGVAGIFVVEAGSAIAVGDEVVSDADGRAVSGSTNAIGAAMDAAALAGEQIRVLIR